MKGKHKSQFVKHIVDIEKAITATKFTSLVPCITSATCYL